MLTTPRHLVGVTFLACFGLLWLSLYSMRSDLARQVLSKIRPSTSPEVPQPADTFLSPEEESLKEDENEEEAGSQDDIVKLPSHPLFKPMATDSPVLIEDNFPMAVNAFSSSDMPPIPSWNRPPAPHVVEPTPLFIGFTRNWRLLQQTVVSYITAGWPPSDIYIVENTGTMNSNKNGRLTLQNPFYIDYHRLVHVFGVNVVTTPTLLTFAQLQNFFLYTAIDKGFNHFFWGHMDVAALSEEDLEPYESLYTRILRVLRETLASDYARDEDGRPGAWAIRFFAYDRLALVNVAAFEAIGGWDTLIPFYGTDCDMHSRIHMAGWKQEDASAGLVYDLGTSLDDLEILYRRKPRGSNESFNGSAIFNAPFGLPDERGSADYIRLRDTLNSMQIQKNSAEEGRNVWQARQNGGQGEPYYRDPKGFEKAIEMTIEFGRTVFAEKWGHRDCDLEAVGLKSEHAWRVEHDWDRPEYLEALDRKRKAAEETEAKAKAKTGAEVQAEPETEIEIEMES